MENDYPTPDNAAARAPQPAPDLDEAASAAPDTPVDCPACGYDLTGTDSFTCSECGYLSIPDDALVALSRRAFLNKSPAKLLALSTIILSITFLLAIFLINKTPYPIIGWIIFTITTFTLTYPSLFTKLIPRHRRSFIKRLWVANAAFLHLPFYAGLIISATFFPINLALPGNSFPVLLIKGLASLLLLTFWGWATGALFLHWETQSRALAHDSWWAQQEIGRTIFRRGAFIIYALNVLLGLATFWAIILYIVRIVL